MIDILMAVYNGEKFISDQIQSILEQSCKEWRLLIHDDGSTDNTVGIIESYRKKYPEKIVIINDGVKTGGARNNFFHLLKSSNAEYLMLSDQDDIWKKDKVQMAYNAIKSQESQLGKDIPILCHSDLKVVDAELKTINESFFDMQKLDANKNKLSDLLVQNNVTGCTVIFNRKLNELCRSMPDTAIMHDWWLGLIAAVFGKVSFMDGKEILYRQHGNNTEGAKNLKSPVYLLKKVLDGKGIRKSLEDTYNQAESFYNEYKEDIGKTEKEIIEAYISMKKNGKLKKLKTLKKYGFMKSGFVRKISYILFV